MLTTRQTLLNPNRNGWTKAQAEAALGEAFGARKVIWIDEGLKNDHTDGHIDNIARFVGAGPRRLPGACRRRRSQRARRSTPSPRTLERATDARGRKLEVMRIPGVGLYRNALGEVSPASHMNFLIANGVGRRAGLRHADAGGRARRRCRRCSPTARSIGVPSRGLLGCGTAGGGSFHCITQQEPR